VGAGARIEDAELASFFWDETEALGLTLCNVSLRHLLCARAARFVQLTLVAIDYAPDLKLVLEGARFEDSDVFAASSPKEGLP
jgi:hypothetical protein